MLDSETNKDFLTLMHLCSSNYSSTNSITAIQCFTHLAPGEDSFGVADAPEPWRELQARTNPKTNNMIYMSTEVSIGSPGYHNPSKSLGFPHIRPNTDSETHYEYPFDLSAPIAPACEIYLVPPYTTHDPPLTLRHGRYCRRAYLHSHAPTTPIPIPLLAAASRATDVLREACTSRPKYTKYYFTRGLIPHANRLLLGETDYLVPCVANMPSLLENPGLGQVNVHRGRAWSVLAFAAAAYGALHCVALAGTFDPGMFPSHVERVPWKASVLAIAVSGAGFWVFYVVKQVWGGFEQFCRRVAESGRDRFGFERWWRLLGCAVVVVFGVARAYLVVEAFVSLGRAPVGVYETVEWTDLLPHL
ncbi:hypothetical protein OQA88_6004 [Cercophora sp. LCS_1]